MIPLEIKLMAAFVLGTLASALLDGPMTPAYTTTPRDAGIITTTPDHRRN